MFVALRGPNFDANAFIAEAQKRGAAGAVAETTASDDFPVVQVEDGLAALQRASCTHRRRYTGILIGVAGSNGKTTTKEMLASILARRAPTLATAGNLNNHIGVPLTLLRLEPQHRHA